MEARIARLENPVVSLSGPSLGIQIGGSETGVAPESEVDPAGYDDNW